jgi:predicted AlkP superfamily pyrophosphatase or phosphodiesterase
LSLIYLPHLDYNLQRFGPRHPEMQRDYARIDSIVGDLIGFFEEREIQPVILSEYGISAVDRPIHLNRIFREQSWISIKEEIGLEILDAGASKAFTVADHQVAHVYLNDQNILGAVRNLLEKVPGVEQVLGETEKARIGLNHERAGDLIVVSDARSWFTYYYWLDDRKAPDFARTVDIHRKPGYDPIELFMDPSIKFPMLKIASKLLKKKLGFRILMDVIPLDAGMVKGSHGRIPTDKREWPILIAPNEMGGREMINSTDVSEMIKMAVLG